MENFQRLNAFLSRSKHFNFVDTLTLAAILDFLIHYYYNLLHPCQGLFPTSQWQKGKSPGNEVGVGWDNGERVMRRCGGIYSVFYVLLKLIDMQWPQYGVHGPHLCTVQVFPRTFLKMRRRGCAPMFASTLLPRKRETPYRIIKLTVFWAAVPSAAYCRILPTGHSSFELSFTKNYHAANGGQLTVEKCSFYSLYLVALYTELKI
jgi:hypothetical protein